MTGPVVLIRGGGDLASGVAHLLAKMNARVIITELARPTMVRRRVSFGNAVYEREVEVEGVRGVLCASVKEAYIAANEGKVAVLVDPFCSSLEFVKPAVLVDAIMAKRNTGTRFYDAPVVIAVGPGFEVGRDCHAVIESLRGADMGRVLTSGSAASPTGSPAEVKGYTHERVLRAPVSGVFQGKAEIGDSVAPGDQVACIRAGAGQARGATHAGVGSGSEGGVYPRMGADNNVRVEDTRAEPCAFVVAQIAGVLRGQLADGALVKKGQKVGDIDPTGLRENCFRMSDKAKAMGRGVVEAIRRLAPTILRAS